MTTLDHAITAEALSIACQLERSRNRALATEQLLHMHSTLTRAQLDKLDDYELNQFWAAQQMEESWAGR